MIFAAFQHPLTPAIILPSCTPAIKSSCTQFLKPGLAAISSIACAISTPLMLVMIEFQLQWFVTPSSFTPKSSPVFPKNEYRYQPELQSIVTYLPLAPAMLSMPSSVATSLSEK